MPHPVSALTLTAPPVKMGWGAWGAQLVTTIMQWATHLTIMVNASVLVDGSMMMVAPLTLATYTVTTRPTLAAGDAGSVIFVSDGGAGHVFQGWTGSAWVSLG